MSILNHAGFGDDNQGVQVQHNTGQITIHHNNSVLFPAEESRKPRHIGHPRRVPHYIDQRRYSDKLNLLTTAEDARVAIVGLGGVGKTQLALYHLHKLKERNDRLWTIWIFAGSAARFDESISELTQQLGLSHGDNTTNPLQWLQNWLLADVERPWVVVLDNVDTDFLLEPATGPVKTCMTKTRIEYFPRCSHGHVIITSRSKSVARRLVDIEEILQLEVMEIETATSYLQRRLGTRLQDGEAVLLANALNCIPLALTQAASYIMERSFFKAADYLSLLEAENTRIRLMHTEPIIPPRDRESVNSILGTWQITFDHLQTQHLYACHRMAAMSEFHHQSIPGHLLRGQRVSVIDADEVMMGHDQDFDDSMLILENYSFISAALDQGAQDFWTMHSLVQDAMQSWLRSRRQDRAVKWQHIKLLHHWTPTFGQEPWSKCQFLLPHIRAASVLGACDQEHAILWSDVLLRAAEFTEDRGNLVDAAAFSRGALHIRSRWLGPDAIDSLLAERLVAVVDAQLGEPRVAEERLIRILALLRRSLDEGHSHTLDAMQALVEVFGQQQRYLEAETLQHSILNFVRNRFGEEDERAISSHEHLAQIYNMTGKHDQALVVQEKAFQARLRKCCHDSAILSNIMNDLAHSYSIQARYDDAANLDRKALVMSYEQSGIGYRTTLACLDTLSVRLMGQGRYREARCLREIVLQCAEECLGAQHPFTRSAELRLSRLKLAKLFAPERDMCSRSYGDAMAQKSATWYLDRIPCRSVIPQLDAGCPLGSQLQSGRDTSLQLVGTASSTCRLSNAASQSTPRTFQSRIPRRKPP